MTARVCAFLWMRGPSRLWTRRCKGNCRGDAWHTHDLTPFARYVLRQVSRGFS